MKSPQTHHTLHCEVCTLLTATLSLCNLATQLTCFEMTEGCDECVREDPKTDLPELCALGSCGSKVLDCYFFYTLLLLLVFIDLGLLLWARHLRSAELRHFRALCKDLGAEQGSTQSAVCCSWASRCRCRRPCRRRVQPLDIRAKVAQSLPRRKTKQLTSSGAHRAGGVPCFFLREKGGRFLPVPGGLCEMMQMEWKDALERVQVKDRASAVPLRRCISRFSRASVGTNAFSRRLAHPTVLEGVETHYMDLGGGEVGYYRYCHLPDAPPLEQVTCMAAEKLEWPGLTEVLEQEDPCRIAELCHWFFLHFKALCHHSRAIKRAPQLDSSDPSEQAERTHWLSQAAPGMDNGCLMADTGPIMLEEEFPDPSVLHKENEWIEVRNPVSERIAHSGDWRIFPHLSNKETWKLKMGTRAYNLDTFLQRLSIQIDHCKICEKAGAGRPSNWHTHIAAHTHFKEIGKICCEGRDMDSIRQEWWESWRIPRGEIAFNYIDGQILMAKGTPPPLTFVPMLPAPYTLPNLPGVPGVPVVPTPAQPIPTAPRTQQGQMGRPTSHMLDMCPEPNKWYRYGAPVGIPTQKDGDYNACQWLQSKGNWKRAMQEPVNTLQEILDHFQIYPNCRFCPSAGDFCGHLPAEKHFKNLTSCLCPGQSIAKVAKLKEYTVEWKVPGGAIRWYHINGMILLLRGEPSVAGEGWNPLNPQLALPGAQAPQALQAPQAPQAHAPQVHAPQVHAPQAMPHPGPVQGVPAAQPPTMKLGV
eukprot:s519_g20.t1